MAYEKVNGFVIDTGYACRNLHCGASGENGTDSLLQEAEMFLEAFHLMSNAVDNAAQVTRAEFAGAVANVMERANQFYDIDNVIRIGDVTEEDANYRAISFLASIGYMKAKEAPACIGFVRMTP